MCGSRALHQVMLCVALELYIRSCCVALELYIRSCCVWFQNSVELGNQAVGKAVSILSEWKNTGDNHHPSSRLLLSYLPCISSCCRLRNQRPVVSQIRLYIIIWSLTISNLCERCVSPSFAPHVFQPIVSLGGRGSVGGCLS